RDAAQRPQRPDLDHASQQVVPETVRWRKATQRISDVAIYFGFIPRQPVEFRAVRREAPVQVSETKAVQKRTPRPASGALDDQASECPSETQLHPRTERRSGKDKGVDRSRLA